MREGPSAHSSLLLFLCFQSVLYTFETILERMDADKKECLKREKVSSKKEGGLND